MKLTKHFFLKMVDLFFIFAFCDQEMFIACLLCKDHVHSICVEHDTDITDHHIARQF
jgi:hypothetical protein